MKKETAHFFLTTRHHSKQRKHLERLLLALLLAWSFHLIAPGAIGAAEKPDFTVLLGEWIRPDGGYTIQVQEVKADSSITAAYFNPASINIAQADLSIWESLIKLYIKLEDEGYPGSTYSLFYYAEKDALAGFYYHALLKQTFEVVFFRKPVPITPETHI